MTIHDPLAFEFNLPDRDTVDWGGIRSTSYRLNGLLHLSSDSITLEWKATRRTEQISLMGIKEEVDESPVGVVQIPRDAILRARVRGWWRPRLQLWGRWLNVFDGFPGEGGDMLVLGIRREDRRRASAIAEELSFAQRMLPGTDD